jgi:hypothetical protein
MATKTAGQGKSAFVRDFLRKNRSANRKAVEEAWREAGHEGSISSALVSTLRRKLGLIGNKRGSSRPVDGDGAAESPKAEPRASRPKKRRRRRMGKAVGGDTAPSSGRKPLAGGRGRALAEIEADIDHLIFKLMNTGGFEAIEAELRKVRRLLYRSSQA